MKLSPKKVNQFLFFKLPSAWFCGVRVKRIDQKHCTVAVKLKWINQNPFQSMYFAVQAMAAELTTGALVMQGIQDKTQKISMLVSENKSEFLKKAKGNIHFTCEDGDALHNAIDTCIKNSDGSTIWMKSVGINEQEDVVSIFHFKWTLKVK